MTVDLRAHWDGAYAEGEAATSWYQEEPATSLELIELLDPPRDAPVVDVGGGASHLVDALLARGFTDLTVLDLSPEALALSRARLGPDAGRVTWVAGDLRDWTPPRPIGVWHDRAVLHFLTDPVDVERYFAQIDRHVAPGGAVVIGTFSPDGPPECAGLPVVGRDAEDLLAFLGADFEAVATRSHTHHTPRGTPRPYAWIAARRR